MAYPIHPAAQIYPMMSDDELEDLAKSIKEHGQYHQIELTEWLDEQEKVVKGIIDGRNREEACTIAGVKPEYRTLDFNRDDDEIRLYIFQSNRLRRSLNSGQMAMSFAMIFPERSVGRPQKNVAKNEERTKNVANSQHFSRTRLSRARKILDHSKKYAEAIMNGNMMFDSVLKIVEIEQKEIASKAAQQVKEMDEIREYLPELVRDVELGTMTREDAVNEIKKRKAEEKEQIFKENRTRAIIFEAMWQFLYNTDAFVGDGTTVIDDLDKENSQRKGVANVPEWLKNPDYLAEFSKQFPRGISEFLERVDEDRIREAVNSFIRVVHSLRSEVRSSIRVVE